MTTRPIYHFPLTLLLPHVPSFLFGQRRSLRADIQLAFDAIHATPCVLGREHIPPVGPFLLVMNHYHRRDIPAWWPAMVALKAVAERRDGHARAEIRLIVASQWTYTNRLERFFVEPFTRFMLSRIARAYNFLPLEPTALGASQTNARAQSIRRVIEEARQAVRERIPLGLAPEGGDSPDGELMHPPSGAGRFMLLLAATGLPFLPVGNYVEGDKLVSNFGPLVELTAPQGLRKSELDEWASREVMMQIARLLPAALRGEYGDAG